MKQLISLLCLVLIVTVLYASGRYDVAGFDDDKAVEKFVSELKSAILAKNSEFVAKRVSYPITVYLNGKTVKNIKNQKEFIEMFDQIFYPDFLQKIKAAKTENLFARYDGVMLGERGEIWISSIAGQKAPKIITINNEIWDTK